MKRGFDYNLAFVYGASTWKFQGWKPEKNLRFLLQKVLKQSDVGNLGRIVLPKASNLTLLRDMDPPFGISHHTH